MVYSLCHHPKEACLLSAASYGPVHVWKKKGWDKEEEEGEEEEEEEEGKGRATTGVTT